MKSIKQQSTLTASKTWTLKNMDPEKCWINIGLKSMSAFREFNKENVQCDL